MRGNACDLGLDSDSQLFAPLQMRVIVDKVIPPLLQRTQVDAGVLTRTGRVVQAYGPGQDLGPELLDPPAV